MFYPHAKRLFYSLLRAANHDFCPHLNKLVYWIKEPIGWVVSAIAFSLLVGVMIGPQGYVLAAAFSAFLVLGLVWPWVSMKGIRCTLLLPQERAREGEDVNITFRVKNFWPLPVFGMMVKGDFLQELEPGTEPIAFSLQHVRAWSETEFTIKVTPKRRGRLPTSDVIVSNGFPFGLVDVSKTVSHAASALVWPASHSLVGFPHAHNNGFSLQGALVDQSGNDGETIGVRSYRDGDRLRNIHWAQSVRSQRLMVRERQKVVASSATIVVDLSPAHHAGQATKSSFECAIRIAATLCNHLHESGSSVRLMCVGLSKESLLCVDNSVGIAAVFDFLAELPTLNHARTKALSQADRETAANEVTPIRLPIFAGRTFFICTDSTGTLNIGDRKTIESIMIQLKEFALDTMENAAHVMPTAMMGTMPPGGELEDDVETERGRGIAIADPDLAASQFATDWNGSYGHVV